MAAFHGKRGTASFSGLTLEVQEFSIEASAEVHDATVMDSSAVAADKHWKAKVVGYKDWKGTMNLVLPAAGLGLAALGTSATLTLDTTDGLAYSGTAILTNINLDSGDKTASAVCSFEGNGQLSAA